MGGPDGKIFGPRSWRTDRAKRGPCAMTEGQIFSRPARPNSVNKHFIIWPPHFSFFFFFPGNKIRNVHLRRSFWPKSRDLYSNKVVLVRISRFHCKTIEKIPVWGPYAILAGPDGFFRPCSRHRVRPSYGDFLNSFAMKARAGPYGSYDKAGLVLFLRVHGPRRRKKKKRTWRNIQPSWPNKLGHHHSLSFTVR